MAGPLWLDPLPGTQGTRADLQRADERARRDPAALTDFDIRLIAAYDQAGAKEASFARTKALDARARTKAAPTSWLDPEFLATSILETIKRALTPRDTRLDALETRLVALETRPAAGGVEYAGTYDQGKAYRPGMLVTRSGSLWLALRDSAAETPGRSPDAWRLVVKSGSVQEEQIA